MIGKNSTGDLVPDPDLPLNERYGNSTYDLDRVGMWTDTRCV